MTPANRRYRGLLLDFGGMLTTDFFASIDDHCERLGSPRGRFRQLVTRDPAGRALYHWIERGEISQAAFERDLAALLEVAPEGLLAGLVGGLEPDWAVIGAAGGARGRHPGGGDHQLLGY
jgi:putative hydrolase of the HAD superfamily